MTYRLAVAQIITAVTGIPRSSHYKPSEFGRLTHDPRMDADTYGGDRSFSLTGVDGHRKQLRNGRHEDRVDLYVDYSGAVNAYELDIAVHSDAEMIIDLLKGVDAWGRPTSTICALLPESDEAFMPYSIEDSEGEGGQPVTRLTVSIRIEHLAGTAN